jgi:hypothetical protein
MFARNVSVHLKPNTLSQFTQTFENAVLPIMRKQSGFRDDIVFVSRESCAGFPSENGTEVTGISLWDSNAQADTFLATTYPQVIKMLERFIDGSPKLGVSTVIINTTCHRNVLPQSLTMAA